MRVALFGGTFDPPHRGHVALARLARQSLSLNRILVAPVAMQPLKQETQPASFEDRMAMARIAFADEPDTEVSLIDAPRADGRSNYTVDTLTLLRRQLGDRDALFCLVGADSFLTLGKWHHPVDLLSSCDWIVGARPGFDLENAAAALPEGVSATLLPSAQPQVQVSELTADDGRRSRLYLLTSLAVDISATQVRAALSGRNAPDGVLAPGVVEYIRAHHLYRASIE